MENQNQPTYITPDKMFLDKLNSWTNFVSIMTIISGALMCLGALTSFGLSLILGIPTIILGVKLRNAKNSLELYIRGNSQEINGIFEHLSAYFKIQGIIMIISIALAVIGFILAIVVGFAFYSEFSNYY